MDLCIIFTRCTYITSKTLWVCASWDTVQYFFSRKIKTIRIHQTATCIQRCLVQWNDFLLFSLSLLCMHINQSDTTYNQRQCLNCDQQQRIYNEKYCQYDSSRLDFIYEWLVLMFVVNVNFAIKIDSYFCLIVSFRFTF